MKSRHRFFSFAILLVVASMFTAFSPNEKVVADNNETLTNCKIYKADISTSLWNTLSEGTAYTTYVVVNKLGDVHTIQSTDFVEYEDFEALVSCLGASLGPGFIVVEDVIDGV